MNETIITPRQKFILNLINQSDSLARGEIQKKVQVSYKISKPTLIRDLNNLVNCKLTRIKGRGKNTKYFSYSNNPLLKPFDLEIYFQKDPDERLGAKKKFDFAIFKNLYDLYTLPELEKIEQEKKSFEKQTSKVDPIV